MRISDWSSDGCSSDLSIAEDSAYSSLIDTRRKGVFETVSVQTICIEDFCSQNSCITNILKIDVEGAELKVLKGASNIFSDSRFSTRMVMIELYDQNLRMFDNSIGDLVSIIKKKRL